MAKIGLGTTKSCISAVNGFKSVAERGDWVHKLTIARRLFDNPPATKSIKHAKSYGYLYQHFNSLLSIFENNLVENIVNNSNNLEHNKLTNNKPRPNQLKLMIFKLWNSFDNVLIYFLHNLNHLWNLFSFLTSKSISVDPSKKAFDSSLYEKKASLSIYAQMASVGYEVAQTNAAYVFTKSFCPMWLSHNRFDPFLFYSSKLYTSEESEGDYTNFQYRQEIQSIIPDQSSWPAQDSHSADLQECELR